MSRKPIRDVIPDLRPRDPGAPLPVVRARLGIPVQTFVLGHEDGRVGDIATDCEALALADWLEAFVVVSRPDGGEFVHALARQQQAIGLLQTNAWYELAERVSARAFVRRDLPVWARRPDGGPLHEFSGVAMPLDVETEP